ncbi:kynurenine formamidase isoform X2 [Belonocnema kinseyi]|uniref:kynurenine formamidase isoform X2 n=1 Tax=Belonocnema kinseyi TaxID=2817044 RepID=UPI00143D6042|nr:kynurenine formamidase isoform X2 [Belonocnema kinseyi]
MAGSELEKAYLPSCWSKRWDAEELLQQYLRKCEDITNKARSSINCELDIPYSTTDRTKYDIYGTNLPKDAPIFVFIHGGYWQEFTKDLSAFAVSTFVSQGIKVITGGYDLCPNVTLTEIMSQTKILVEKILKDAYSSGSRVWIAGHSAGAQMAASLLHDKNWLSAITQKGYKKILKGLILIGGVYDLKPLLLTSMNEALKLTPEEIKSFSFAPIEQTDNSKKSEEPIRDIKVILTVGECDSPVFIKESKRYAQRLLEFVDNVEFVLLRNNTDHFDIVENLTQPDFLLTKLILQNIKSQ